VNLNNTKFSAVFDNCIAFCKTVSVLPSSVRLPYKPLFVQEIYTFDLVIVLYLCVHMYTHPDDFMEIKCFSDFLSCEKHQWSQM